MARAQWETAGNVEPPPVGTEVEVRQRYTERWAGGFEVARIDLSGTEPGVEVRRRSDGSVVPVTFDLHDVRGA